jgi:hypothetical protein
MAKKKKNFYDEYDALFTKPTLKSSTKRAKRHKKTTRTGKAKNATHSRLSLAIVIGIACIVGAMQLAKQTRLHSTHVKTDAEEEYQEVYPLKAANVEVTGEKAVDQPLSLTLKDHTFDFNKGYQLTFNADSHLKVDDDADTTKALLPTDSSYAEESYVAEMTMYDKNDNEQYLSLIISANLVNSNEEYITKDDVSFAKAYPEAEVGTVKTGHLLSYEKYDDMIAVDIMRYFIFTDGTGVVVKIAAYEEPKQALTQKDSYQTVKKVFPIETAVLDNQIKLSQAPAKKTE